jgi:hypothetical protein
MVTIVGRAGKFSFSVLIPIFLSILTFTNFTLAQMITANVSGTVTSVTTYGSFSFDESVITGSTMTGACSYDPSTAVDFDGSEDDFGIYYIPSISMTIGNYDFSIAPLDAALFRVEVPDISYFVQTRAGIMSWNDMPLHYTHISVTLLDLCNASVSGVNDDLPTAFPDISFFTYSNRFSVTVMGEKVFTIEGVINSITVVPEPATMALLVVGVAFLRRRRMKIS